MAKAEIVKRVLVTEKSERVGTENRYAIEVDPAARKPQIAEAVEKKFGVHVLAVRTVVVKGASKYVRGTRRLVQEPARKKAYVTVKAGERIEQV